MSEKIDLATIARHAWDSDGRTHPDIVLALVRAVRAARRCHPDTFVSLPDEVDEYVAALAHFTDSAEVRSDGS